MKKSAIAFLVIFVIAISIFIWYYFNGIKVTKNYRFDGSEDECVIFFKIELTDKIKSYFNGNDKILEITKLKLVKPSGTYEFVLTGRKILTDNADFVFSNVDFNDDLESYLNIQPPKAATDKSLLKMKHANSAYFPTLYLYMYEFDFKKHTDLIVSWP